MPRLLLLLPICSGAEAKCNSAFFYIRGSSLDDSREILYRRQIIHFLLLFPSYEKERKGKGTKIFTMAAGYVMHYTYTKYPSFSAYVNSSWVVAAVTGGEALKATEEEEGKREGGALRQQHIPDFGGRESEGWALQDQIISVYLPILGGLTYARR